MDYQAALNQLVAQFQMGPAPVPGPALEPTFAIQAPQELLLDGNLVLPEATQSVAPVPGLPVKVDLAFVAKNVRFVDTDPRADPTQENPIGGMPVMDPLALGTTLNTQLPPGSLMHRIRTWRPRPGCRGSSLGSRAR